MTLPTLETARLIIRPLTVNDAEDMFVYAKTNLVGPSAGWAPHNSVEETRDIIYGMLSVKARYDLGNWAIVLKETKHMIGTIELYNCVPAFKAELGYALNPEYWGRGIMKEAGLAVLEYGFNCMHYKRIEAGTFLSNIQSQRVCEYLGFTKEGIARNGYIRYDGIIFDKLVYGITNKEFETRKKQLGI